MSVPNKSIDKSKRYAGVKANDFVNKTRTNETSRAAARTQGWANLGKINSRRIPPPANLPSLKSETGTVPPSFDPTIPTGASHGWTASGNPASTSQTRPLTPSKQPTQQQLDSLPANASTPPPSQSSSDLDKPRLPTTWSAVTAGNNPSTDQPPNLLGLNDFPRLVTQENKSSKSPSDSIVSSISTTNQGPSLRPANLASWKEGGGRAQPLPSDSSKDSNENSLSMQSQVLNNNMNPNSLQSQMPNPSNSSYMRMYQQPQQQQPSQQMWSYNQSNSYGSYGTNPPPPSMSMHQLHHHHHQQQQPSRMSSYGGSHQSQNQQRLNTSTDYKTPTILRNKDIDDLSKLTDNVTWASASQEVNYEEKIRFSDDEENDTVDHTNKSRRFNHSQQQQQQPPPSRQTYPQVLQNNNRSLQTTRSRLLHEDEHVKQMQDDKNSELISTLTVAKQRRDEQERHLRDQRTTSNEQKQIPGYQTRPLLTSTGQENLPSSQTDSSSSWGQTNSGTTTTTNTITTTTTTSRTRHDTADSQTFAMKSWSDQMDSFNYASLHEKAGGQVEVDEDSTNRPRKYSQSQSESSSQSQPDHSSTQNRSKHFPITTRKPTKPNLTQPRIKSKTTDVIDYFEHNDRQMKSNDQWGDWEDSNYSSNNRYQQQYSQDRRRQQPQQHQQSSDDLPQKSNRFTEQTNDYNRTKPSTKTRSNTNRSSDIQSTKSENKSATNKSQPAWRALSPPRPIESIDPTPQEAISHKSQIKTNEVTDRRQSAPTERKSRYTTTTVPPINTSSIPPLMSVRSDVPLTTVSSAGNTTTSKHFKTSNQSQRTDYNTSSHYSQRNDFYNETNDSAWGNDDEYYDDDTGYYDSTIQTHPRHSTYHTHLHHRGYTTLGSYGRYRRGGTLRHQQQYSTYSTNNTSNTSPLNTSTGSRTKKSVTNRTITTASKKAAEPSSEQIKPADEPVKVVADESVQKSSAWNTEPKSSTIEEIPITKSVETPPVPAVIEKPKEVSSEQKTENESNVLGQTDTDYSTSTNKKSSSATYAQKKSNKDQQNYYQDQRYANQQTTRHRNAYARSAQDYEIMPISENYFGANRRTARGGRTTRMQDLSSGYYYEHPQQRYNSRYSYSTDPYHQHSQTRSVNQTSKRGSSATAGIDRQQTKSQSNAGIATLHHQSVSDNEQKEGEEWETASESSANMRNNHHETNHQVSTNETVSANRDRTPPKKSFSSQRPINTRYNEGGIHRRTHASYDRGTKSTRGIRTSRLTANQKQVSSYNNDEETSSKQQAKKDQHRHSLDGYDLNNVAGVVKIETLPASALEEESAALDDGGEEFCVVMSKRGRKEQKAAQLSKQNAVESSNEPLTKSASIDNDEQQTNEKLSNDPNQSNATRSRNGKSVPPRFNSKSSTRQSKADSMYYYDQNYYYYDQNQYYDHDGSYYNYNNYSNQTQRPSSTRRKPRSQQSQENNPMIEGRKIEPEKTSLNVMSNIQMWDPHTDSTLSNSSKLIEKPTHERKFPNEIVSKDASLPLPLASHSTVSKPNETIARTIKPPTAENKSERETKTKPANYEKSDTISSLGSNQLFEKSTFLDYDDKQSIGTVGDDYNQKINSLKTLWDISDHSSGQLEQTINSMVAMQQHHHQDTGVKSSNPTKSDNYVQESKPVTSAGSNTNVSSAVNEDANNKNSSANANLQSTGSSSTINQSSSYSTNPNAGKNEQKNICTVKPTQQVPPNIQDQVDVNVYQTFPPPPLPPPMSQASLQQQHLLPQSQVNPLHQQHTYPFYDTLLPPQQQQQQQQPPQQQQFNRMYPSTTNSASTDPLNSDFSSVQSSQIYPPQNFPYRNANVYMPPPNVPNTNSMYHHTSQGSLSAPPQNNAMPPPMASYPSPFLVDPGAHMISQPQPPQAYMNNQMMSGRPQGTPYYRTPPQQQLQTPPGPPPYNAQDPLAHGGYYPFFQPPNSNAPPVGHPSPHNLYGQNEGFHPPPHHPQMFARGGSIDRGDHPLMSQSLSRPSNYPSNSSNQQQPPSQGPPPSLLSQNIKPFHANQPQTSSSNQAPFYPPPLPPNQYNRQPVPVGAMNTGNNRQQTQQVPSLMSGISKTFPTAGNNLNNTPSLFQHRQPLLPPQSNTNRPLYQQQQQQQHNQYSNYSKSTGPNDDNVKPKHI